MPSDVTLGWLFIGPLAALAVVVHATALRAIAKLALSRGSPARRHIALAVLAMLVAHTAEIWIFAGGLYAFDLISGTARLRGNGFTGTFRGRYIERARIYAKPDAGQHGLVWPGADRLLLASQRWDRTFVPRKARR